MCTYNVAESWIWGCTWYHVADEDLGGTLCRFWSTNPAKRAATERYTEIWTCLSGCWIRGRLDCKLKDCHLRAVFLDFCNDQYVSKYFWEPCRCVVVCLFVFPVEWPGYLLCASIRHTKMVTPLEIGLCGGGGPN